MIKLTKDQIEQIINSVISNKDQYNDLYLESTERTSIQLDDNKIETVNFGIDEGAGIRLVDGNSSFYVYTNILDFKNLVNVGKELKQNHIEQKNPIKFEKDIVEIRQKVQIPLDEVSTRKKAEMLLKCNEAARNAGKEIKQVSIVYFDGLKAGTIINSENINDFQERNFIRFIVQVVAAKDGIVQTAFEAPGLQRGFEFFEKYNPGKLGRDVALTAIKMLDAQNSPSGPMQVVLAAGSGGVIFHEAVGHGLEADEVEKGSVFRNQIGQKVAADCITLIDDPTIEGLWGSYAFDEEGVKAQRTVLIENGILKSYLCDRFSGKRIGFNSTGNGRRENYSFQPIPRMSNTFLQQGGFNTEEIIQATKKGLYAKKLGGGQVDPQSGDFVFSVTEGYLIENGKIGQPVKGATLIGNGPKILKLIDLVGNDLEFDPGTCGKEGQGVPVTTGQPTIRIKEITVGGMGK
jgi:TldD protein